MGSPPEEGISGVDMGLQIFSGTGERGVGKEFCIYVYFFFFLYGAGLAKGFWLGLHIYTFISVFRLPLISLHHRMIVNQ